MIWIVLLIPLTSFAGFNSLENSYDYKFEETSARKVKTKKDSNAKSKLDHLLANIKSSDEKISKILENGEKRIIVRKSQDILNSLTRIRGVLLNSILSTNKKATTIVIRLIENEFFENAEVRCHGLTFGKRVEANCDLIVSEDKEYQITAELWDLDGAQGLIADQFYDGQEKEFLTSSFSSFFQGVLGATKDRVMTPYGEVEQNNGKNQILSGLMGVGQNANSKIKESSDKNLKLALINSGKEVFVFFQRRLIL